MKTFALLFFLLTLVGCTGMSSKHYLSKRPNTAELHFKVDIDKEFVQGMSSLATGQIVMYQFAGPFTNNAVILEATEKMENGEEVAFRQRLSWGKNEFKSFLKQGVTYELSIVLQGTRAGEKVFGTIPVERVAVQDVNITLNGNSTKISKISDHPVK